ncbi:MAG: TonB-dependent receptor [Chitinophagaceae bacterium]|nr:TonB-dependent receptor [Chitinophagaceae bacterium]
MKKFIHRDNCSSASFFVKVMLYMKLSSILILGFCLQVSAKGYSQGNVKISVHLVDVQLKKALSVIEKKSGYRIFYSDDDLPERRSVSIQAEDISLTEVLSRVLPASHLQYRIIDNNAVVISAIKAPDGIIYISGRVVDEKSQPLSGVSVRALDSQLGTVTDAGGYFDLRFPDDVSSVVVFSYVGYEEKHVKVKNNQKLSIVLARGLSGLDEVVVVGYGTQKKTSVTAAVSTVGGEEIAKAPVANISSTLGGRVAGVISRQNSGAPGGDGDRVQIRGIGTTGNSAPLVVVNGVPMDYDNLNPNEIESVTVLKDAAAVAPYGLAGANGVILVVTKRGKEGKFSLNYDGFYGLQQPTRMPKFLDAYGYANLLSIANQNIGNPATYTPEELQKFKDGSDPDHFPNTDWVNSILSLNAPMTRHTLSFAGGTQKLRFYSNLGYLFQEGAVPNINFKRYNMTANVDAEVTATTTVSLDINASYGKQTNPSGQNGTAIFTNVTEIPPILPLRYTNGLYAHTMLPSIYESGYNRNNSNIFNAKLQIEQKIPFVRGLALKGAVAYNRNYSTSKIWSLPITFYSLNALQQYMPQPSGPPSPTLSQEFLEGQRVVLQAYLTYDRSFGKHNISALGVFESQEGSNNSIQASRINYAVLLDELSMGSSNKNDFNNGGLSDSYAQVGWVYQANYTYAGKYILGLSGRYNGHYYFAPGKRYAFFPAASVGWRISEENFIKDNYSWIDNLKIRGSYGVSGNLAGNPFQYLTSYGLRNSYIFGGVSPVQVQGIFENAQSNPDITWETANKTNIGLDGSLWRGKLGFTIDVFKERRSDMLITPMAVVPVEYGIGISQVNAGIMENKGVELSLNTQQVFDNQLRLEADFNLSYARNKLIQTFENASTYNNPNRRTTGRPWNAQFGLKDLGLYQLSDFEADGVALKAGQPVPTYGPVRPGDIKYADIAGPAGPDGKPTAPDGKIDINDYTKIGDPLFPQITYGLNLSLAWKGFDITTFWQGAAKASLYLSAEMAVPFFNGAKIFEEQTDYWTLESPNASYPRLTPTPITNNTQPSSFWIKNGNFLRLKTLEIGYSLPEPVMQAIKLRSVRLFVSGQNLLTFSKLRFLDPELGNERGRYYFQQKTYSFGINVRF